ncbi:MAG: hypothetical protein ACK4OK_06290 [Thermoflexus sp.]
MSSGVNERSLPLGLQMLGPGLMVLGVMLPWGISSEAHGLNGWGLLVLLIGIPTLLLPWAARETATARPILAGLTVIAAVGALGGWITAWHAVPPDVPDPMRWVGKGPLFTLAGAALTWATLPESLKGWQRALVAGGGFGLMFGIAMGAPAWIAIEGKGASAAMGGAISAPTGTPWIVIEVRPLQTTPAISGAEQPLPFTPSPTFPPFSSMESGPEPGGAGVVEGPTLTPPMEVPTATPGGQDVRPPTPSPTVHSPISPPPTPSP